MLLPRMDRKSWCTGFLPFSVTLALRKYVFIDTSTPNRRQPTQSDNRQTQVNPSRQNTSMFLARVRAHEQRGEHSPVIVPETTVPFLSSIVTDSLFNFIKNLDTDFTRTKSSMGIRKKTTGQSLLLNSPNQLHLSKRAETNSK
jgi:hypothetical protein